MNSEMSLANLLKEEFESPIRVRGRDYFLEDRAKLNSRSDVAANFKVVGEETYYSNISYDEDSQEFGLDCTCPYFEANFNCKHLWASILEADRLRLLPSLMGQREIVREKLIANSVIKIRSRRRLQRVIATRALARECTPSIFLAALIVVRFSSIFTFR